MKILKNFCAFSQKFRNLRRWRYFFEGNSYSHKIMKEGSKMNNLLMKEGSKMNNLLMKEGRKEGEQFKWKTGTIAGRM